MAKVGAPKGSKNHTIDKPGKLFSDAIRREVAKAQAKGKGPDRAARIACALLDKAESGDIHAITVLLDRIEGKPAQSVSLTGGDESDLPVAITIKGK